jgi:hypothetical protein
MAKQHSFSVTIVTDDATSDELKDSLEYMLWMIEMPTGETLNPVEFSVAHLSTIEEVAPLQAPEGRYVALDKE